MLLFRLQDPLLAIFMKPLFRLQVLPLATLLIPLFRLQDSLLNTLLNVLHKLPLLFAPHFVKNMAKVSLRVLFILLL